MPDVTSNPKRWSLRLGIVVVAAACLSGARSTPTGTWCGALDWKALPAAAASNDPFVKLMAEEFTGPPGRQVTFTMGCFWRGEGELGSIDGVIATAPGNLGSREAVKVTFNPAVVTYDQLLAQAKLAHVADDVLELSDLFRAGDACTAGPVGANLTADDGPKFYLQQSPLRAVPMTAAQACRVDGALLHHQSPLVYLSPPQRKLAEAVLAAPDQDRPNFIGVPVDQAWAAAAD